MQPAHSPDPSQIGPGSNNNPGIYAYKDLPLAGASVFENVTDISSYSYDAAKQEFVSYDTPNIVKLKVQYAQSKGFAGSMVGRPPTIHFVCAHTAVSSSGTSPPTRPVISP